MVKERTEKTTRKTRSSRCDTLVRDLTAHRTLGLRLNLSEQPDVAIVAVTHALAAQIFYIGANAHVVGIQPVKTDLATHAPGIEDTPAGKAWSDRHANWARQMPRDVAKLWEFVVELDHDSRMALFAHCAALTVNAVKLPFDLRPRALAAASRLAGAIALDMTGYWRPTVQSYLGRVTKAGIVEAVREGVSEEAAERISGMKKAEMAVAAEQLLAVTEWLPPLLRTAKTQDQAGARREALRCVPLTDVCGHCGTLRLPPSGGFFFALVPASAMPNNANLEVEMLRRGMFRNHRLDRRSGAAAAYASPITIAFARQEHPSSSAVVPLVRRDGHIPRPFGSAGLG